MPAAEGRRGRASVYCSAACRQRAYRSRRPPAEGASVRALIAEIERRVRQLDPTPPRTFYADVSALAGSVGRLRRIARVASDAAGDAEPPTGEPPAPARTPVPPNTGERPDVAETVRTGDEGSFAGLVEPFRRELGVHCYRMVGSYDDSEGLVQETFLLAWRSRESFAGRSTLRAWLYRVATNACLDFLRRTDRRPQRYEPMPGTDPGGPEPPARLPWLQPYPDQLLDEIPGTDGGPDVAAVSRETTELAFLAAIHHLPPEQRAVLLLRDVLDFSAADIADLLETSVAAVHSALRRARPALREHLPRQRTRWSSVRARTEEERDVLERYIDVAGREDVAAMADMLSADAQLTMPPAPTWCRGSEAILSLVGPVFDRDSPRYAGRWKHRPTWANRQPAAAAYVQRPGTMVYRAQVLDVLRVEDGRIAEITSFEPHLFPAFGLPLTVDD